LLAAAALVATACGGNATAGPTASPTNSAVSTTTAITVAPTTVMPTSTTRAPAPTTTTSTLPPLILPKVVLRVGVRSYDWIDTSRPTPANGNYRARNNRELVTTIWYPAVGAPSPYTFRGALPDRAHGPYPIVLFAHGHGGEPAAYTAIVTNWVSRGYVVVAPAFPLSRSRALGGPSYDDLLSQPGDLSYVLDRVLADNVDAGSWMYQMLDARRVAAVGHSMGAWTVLGLVGNQCCRDRRVTAAIVLAGEMAPAFTTKFFTKPAPPLLFVHARDDDVVPYSEGRRAYAAASRPKYLLTVNGAHIQPYWGPKTPIGATVLQVTNDFLDHYVRGITTVGIVSPDRHYGTIERRVP
jgi:dienelactone hydrolase